jgi:cobalt-zinc-cadmium efflux system membrane fusion protein
MRMRMSVLMLALGLATGCGRCGGNREAQDHEERPEAAARTAADEHELPNELQIPPDMLRDVRMTTTAVESRAAAESSSTLVGELRVNEQRYGEVVAPVSGRVSRVLVDVGQRVRAGQPLAEIQSTELGRASAAYFTAQARAELARRALERKRTLADEKIAPLREVQEAQAEADAAQADLRAARAGLSALGIAPASLAIEDSASSALTLRAPVGGVVIARDVVVGQAAEADTPLFRVGDLSRLWLIVHAFERDAVRVTLGASASIAFAALPGQPFTGRVTLIGRQVDVESRTVPLRIEVDNPGDQLRPGMSASATLPLGAATSNILAVPVVALQRLGDDWVVFIPKEDGHFDIRPVGRGRDFGNEVEILRGVKAGERVVVEGAFVLKAEAEKARAGGDAHAH